MNTNTDFIHVIFFHFLFKKIGQQNELYDDAKKYAQE